ncbi:TPA: hypothetical protein ACG1X2_004983, partial [Escherichia coli]
SGAPGCVTWELILDGYSESSYSATPRFAAARLPRFNSRKILFIQNLEMILKHNHIKKILI